MHFPATFLVLQPFAYLAMHPSWHLHGWRVWLQRPSLYPPPERTGRGKNEEVSKAQPTYHQGTAKLVQRSTCNQQREM